MKNKDWMTMATVAAGTAALTVMTFWPGALEAGGEAEAITTKIAKPKLAVRGLEVTLAAAEGRTFKADDEPVFELTAVNPTGQPVETAVKVTVASTSAASKFSRMPVMPSMLWQHSCPLALKPNETKVLRLAAPIKLPANCLISVNLAETGQAGGPVSTEEPTEHVTRRAARPFFPAGVAVLSFSTAAAGAETASSPAIPVQVNGANSISITAVPTSPALPAAR